MEAPQVGGTQLGDDDDGTQDDQGKKGGVAILDPPDGELLPKEDATGKDDECREGKIKGVRSQSQRLPSVTDQREDGEGQGDDLIEEENQTEGAVPTGEEDGKGLGAGVSLCNPLGNDPEEG